MLCELGWDKGYDPSEHCGVQSRNKFYNEFSQMCVYMDTRCEVFLNINYLVTHNKEWSFL